MWLYIEHSLQLCKEVDADSAPEGRVAELRLISLSRREEAVMLALLAEEERIRAERRHRRPKQMWVRPWLLRRPVRESDGRVGEGGKRGLQCNVIRCHVV